MPWAAADPAAALLEPPSLPNGLVSGEAVELEVRVARIGSRVLALLLDILVQVGLVMTLFFVAMLAISLTIAPAADPALLQAVLIGCLAVALVGYPTVCETLLNGRTLGKLALGLRVVRDDGGPIRFRHALVRSLVGVAVEWPGLVMPLLDLTGLDNELAMAVRHFLARNREIAEPARSRLGYTLALEVARCTTPPPPPGVPGWAYLAAVLAERHRRAAHRLAIARTATAAVWPGLGAPTPLTAAPPPAPASIRR